MILFPYLVFSCHTQGEFPKAFVVCFAWLRAVCLNVVTVYAVCARELSLSLLCDEA